MVSSTAEESGSVEGNKKEGNSCNGETPPQTERNRYIPLKRSKLFVLRTTVSLSY